MKKCLLILCFLTMMLNFSSCSNSKKTSKEIQSINETQNLLYDCLYENDYFSLKYPSQWTKSNGFFIEGRGILLSVSHTMCIYCCSTGPYEEYEKMTNSEFISQKLIEFENSKIYKNENGIEFISFTISDGKAEKFMCLSSPWVMEFEFDNFSQNDKNIITDFMNTIKIKEQKDKIEISTEKKTERQTEPSTTKKPISANSPTEPRTEKTASESNETLGQQNVLKSAKSYIGYSAFSYLDLVEQLEYEGYSHEEAVYGADNCGADWNDEALESAMSYIGYSAFSYVDLVERLEYEQFTHEQAVYGADNCGADWFQEAAECAESYIKYSSFSREELLDQLLYDGFTQEQAEYGVQSVGY